MGWLKKLLGKKEEQETYELIDGWRLRIATNDGIRQLRTLEHPEFRTLWKIYGWYLTRDSEKYNIETEKGYELLHRNQVVHMELRKIKLIKKDWIKGEDDETKT